MSLEDDLRAALEREPAPPDFAARVLAKTRVLPFWRRPVVLAMAAALAVAALLPTMFSEYQQRRRGLEAKEQLIAALSITRVQLNQAKEKVRQNTTRHKL